MSNNRDTFESEAPPTAAPVLTGPENENSPSLQPSAPLEDERLWEHGQPENDDDNEIGQEDAALLEEIFDGDDYDAEEDFGTTGSSKWSEE
ncbi:hypothetical protein HDU96_004979, partial [Phlyctochytrium bullatum]